MRNKDEVTAIVVSVVTAVHGIRVIECQLEREEMLTIEQIWWIVFSKTSKRRGILLLTPYKSISLHVQNHLFGQLCEATSTGSSPQNTQTPPSRIWMCDLWVSEIVVEGVGFEWTRWGAVLRQFCKDVSAKCHAVVTISRLRLGWTLTSRSLRHPVITCIHVSSH